MPSSTVKQWSKESHTKITIPCPSLIHAYNEHMGRIDLSDMLVHASTPSRGDGMFPCFDTSLTSPLQIPGSFTKGTVASWMRNRCLSNDSDWWSPTVLSQFNKPVSKVGWPPFSFPPPEKTGDSPRPSWPKPQPDVCYDYLAHCPIHCEKRGRCNLRPKGASRWKCSKCSVFLCLVICCKAFLICIQRSTGSNAQEAYVLLHDHTRWCDVWKGWKYVLICLEIKLCLQCFMKV